MDKNVSRKLRQSSGKLRFLDYGPIDKSRMIKLGSLAFLTAFKK